MKGENVKMNKLILKLLAKWFLSGLRYKNSTKTIVWKPWLKRGVRL